MTSNQPREARSVFVSMDQIEPTPTREVFNPRTNLHNLLADFATFHAEGSVSNPVNRAPTNEELRKLAQNYMIPSGVRLVLDAEIHLANSTSIVTALFAASLLGLMQVKTEYGVRARFWHTVAAILNLQQAFFSILIIKQCAELPYKARILVLDPSSWPSRVANGESLDLVLLTHQERYRLLVSFGMGNTYRFTRQLYDVLFVFTVLVTMAVLLEWLSLEQLLIMPASATWATTALLFVLWEAILMPFGPTRRGK